ncbi:Uma2 family endonuclease [Polaribacter batillariae]|uniref:Uma2 family endonuclease n=1 Tax=Polaribacter batillariae TaxID=2808900 RepID=A0ABX7SYC8_9FLAO|nr:Uma2 family endonuclease [Polaribacter batillariae]QTD39227.1 Uma2 family endonuclease [Polaribacter batillariae]
MENTVEESVLDYGKVYTYADYLQWRFKERIEIIKGKVFKMSPTSARNHQFTSRELSRIFVNFFHKTDCEVYIAPFDVRLVDKRKNSTKDEDIITVFQPDLCVICDKNKLDDKGCIGAPDLIIEILSPSNSNREMKNKYELYEENGVRAYWIVDYVYKTIHRYVLKEGIYIGLKPLIAEEIATSSIFSDLSFTVGEIFED